MAAKNYGPDGQIPPGRQGQLDPQAQQAQPANREQVVDEVIDENPVTFRTEDLVDPLDPGYLAISPTYRRIKVFKTPNLINPIDPFSMFYKTINKSMYSQLLERRDNEYGGQYSRIYLGQGRSFNGSIEDDIDLQEGLSSVTSHRSPRSATYFNWSYGGYDAETQNGQVVEIKYGDLYRGEGSPDLSKKWNNAYFFCLRPKK